MKIFYPEKPERSHFLKEIENAIEQNRETLLEGNPIIIDFFILHSQLSLKMGIKSCC